MRGRRVSGRRRSQALGYRGAVVGQKAYNGVAVLARVPVRGDAPRAAGPARG